MFRDHGTSSNNRDHLSFLLESDELPGAKADATSEPPEDVPSLLGFDPVEPDAPQSPFDSLLDERQSLPSVSRDTRRRMREWTLLEDSLLIDVPLQGPPVSKAPARTERQPTSTPSTSTSVPAPYGVSNAALTTIVPAIRALAGDVTVELERNLYCLLSLNPSRREALARHLDCLAGLPHGPSATGGLSDAAAGLRRWIEGPRTPAQEEAIRVFVEEVALFSLTQAVLLKAWSDRGVRPWREQDLGQLNWVLSHSIKPFVPLNREGWQLTRPNLYSWYNPSAEVQRQVWSTFNEWNLGSEGPELLSALSRACRPERLDWPEFKGYDSRFVSAVWEALPRLGFDPKKGTRSARSKPVVFSPTLRDGAWARSAPVPMDWVGAESYPFQLMIAEMTQLWWGPAAPPLWAIGTGLEAHSKEQLAMSWNSPKPSLFSRISEMEACDLALVLEERVVRAQGRSPEAIRFKNHTDSLPYFKKLRASGTSLGDLQACVSMTKLRPGGLLVWIREQRLSSKDGQDMLKFLLERGTLQCEWDFSRLEHSLPASVPPFPPFVYIFRREADTERRRAHRPDIIQATGPVRSHVEIPGLLADALAGDASHRMPSTGWKIAKRISPTSQQEWMEKWPDPAAHDAVEKVTAMERIATPLGQTASVRAVSRQELESTSRGIRGNRFWQSALWVHLPDAAGEEKNALRAEPLGTAFSLEDSAPSPGLPDSTDAPGTQQPKARSQSGFMVVLPGPEWVAPISAYLESGPVREWMTYHVETRAGRWVLKEQNIKLLPVPKSLIDLLGSPDQASLPEGWSKGAADVAYQPAKILKKLKDSTEELAGMQEERRRMLHATLFVRASEAIVQLEQSQNRLFSLVSPDGTIRWKELLEILPPAQCVPFSAHPEIRLSGTLPPHLPIATIRQVRTPMPGLFFATDTGLNCHAGTEQPMLLEMFASSVTAIRAEMGHPTWSELTRSVLLPRSLELARTTASDILRSHAEQSARRRELFGILSACSLF